MSSLFLRTSLAILPLLVLAAPAQAQRAAAIQPEAAPSVAVADLDGDGRADVVFTDLDGDSLTDVVPLSTSRTRHDTVKNSISNVRAVAAPELDLGDLDGDGSSELALLGARQGPRTLNDGTRGLLSLVRREVAGGRTVGVQALIAGGWLAPGAAGGNPLAHVIPNPPGPVSGPVPIPYPDPENPGGGTGGGTNTGGGTTGGGFPLSTGDEAGTASGPIRRR